MLHPEGISYEYNSQVETRCGVMWEMVEEEYDGFEVCPFCNRGIKEIKNEGR